MSDMINVEPLEYVRPCCDAWVISCYVVVLCQSKKAPTQKGNKYSHCFQYVINNETNILTLFEISNIKCIFAS